MSALHDNNMFFLISNCNQICVGKGWKSAMILFLLIGKVRINPQQCIGPSIT